LNQLLNQPSKPQTMGNSFEDSFPKRTSAPVDELDSAMAMPASHSSKGKDIGDKRKSLGGE
jgi:hypothetical protein